MAVLVTCIDDHCWIAKEGTFDVLLKLDDATYKVGDRVNFNRKEFVLQRYYVASYES